MNSRNIALSLKTHQSQDTVNMKILLENMKQSLLKTLLKQQLVSYNVTTRKVLIRYKKASHAARDRTRKAEKNNSPHATRLGRWHSFMHFGCPRGLRR